ncbi:hypothetical protein [Demequina litorisediminis]|uniref:Uncharacterized protein n=1 Tax=Demequina litorisediminis TaxID=1849022 RepID=A0ABQ6IA95_9MICO|nr:hypothetical protein [Demequina litorisediminis]GMA34750.1 hypothetical protein GCM10025876_09540 [Demequina litorisediminis]
MDWTIPATALVTGGVTLGSAWLGHVYSAKTQREALEEAGKLEDKKREDAREVWEREKQAQDEERKRERAEAEEASKRAAYVAALEAFATWKQRPDGSVNTETEALESAILRARLVAGQPLAYALKQLGEEVDEIGQVPYVQLGASEGGGVEAAHAMVMARMREELRR